MTHQFRLKRLGLRTGALLAAGGLALGGTLLLAVGWSLGIWACGWMLASALGIMAAGRGIEGFLLFVFAPLVLALGLPSHLLGLRLIRASVRASSHPRRPAAEVFPVGPRERVTRGSWTGKHSEPLPGTVLAPLSVSREG